MQHIPYSAGDIVQFDYKAPNPRLGTAVIRSVLQSPTFNETGEYDVEIVVVEGIIAENNKAPFVTLPVNTELTVTGTPAHILASIHRGIIHANFDYTTFNELELLANRRA